MELIRIKPNFVYYWLQILGDSSFWGWMITVTYLIALLLAGRYYLMLKTSGRHQLRSFWLLISVVLFVLGVNKQLDFQTLFFIIAHKLNAQLNLWGVSFGANHGRFGNYRNGFFVEAVLFILISIITIAGTIIAIKKFASSFSEIYLEAIGLGLLLVFSILRVLSIYRFEYRFHIGFLFSHPHALEFFSLLIIIWAALRKAKVQEMVTIKKCGY